ncbi:MAG: hypothetical protein LUC34_07340 [Campylobacter sp.]|nr:hypothetical protein [Campylobacter sp.]
MKEFFDENKPPYKPFLNDEYQLLMNTHMQHSYGHQKWQVFKPCLNFKF